jgi:hypothetical protein
MQMVIREDMKSVTNNHTSSTRSLSMINKIVKNKYLHNRKEAEIKANYNYRPMKKILHSPNKSHSKARKKLLTSKVFR